MLTEASLQHLQRLLREGKLNNLTDEEILSAIELLNQQKKIAVPSFEAAQAMVPVVQEILASCPHLLEPQYRGKEDPMTGHCYVGTEALFHMLGGYDQKTWGAETVSHEGGPHWFLRHKPSGKVIDPTASQFKTQVPYEQGIPKGMQPFYQFAKRTGNPNKMIPSARTLEVILRVFNQAIESHKLTLAKQGKKGPKTEAFLTSLVNSEGGQTVLLDVYKNPTRAELRELGDNLRGVIASKDAYLWAARGATHSDITDSVPEAKGGIHALFYFTPGLLKVHIPPYSHHPDDHVTLKRLKTLPWLSQLKLPIQVKIGFLSAPWEPLQLK